MGMSYETQTISNFFELLRQGHIEYVNFLNEEPSGIMPVPYEGFVYGLGFLKVSVYTQDLSNKSAANIKMESQTRLVVKAVKLLEDYGYVSVEKFISLCDSLGFKKAKGLTYIHVGKESIEMLVANRKIVNNNISYGKLGGGNIPLSLTMNIDPDLYSAVRSRVSMSIKI